MKNKPAPPGDRYCAVRLVSCSVVTDSATPWTEARQAPLPMEFSRQEYWSGLPCLLQGISPTLGSLDFLCLAGER